MVCEEKYMGSRTVVYLTPDGGSVYIRTGRSFFTPDLTTALLDRVRAAVTKAGIDTELATDWLLLETELWSAKAGPLLRDQYAPVGAAALDGSAAGGRCPRRGAAAGCRCRCAVGAHPGPARQHPSL